MSNILPLTAKLSLFVTLLTASAQAAAPAAPAQGAFQRDLLGVYGYTQKQVLDLLDAMPAKSFGWRPGPGVRSVAETYLHMASANYGLTSLATGKAPPAEAGFTTDMAKWDKQTKDKAAVKKILEASFAFVHTAVAAVPDADLDKQVDFFGHPATIRAVLIILASHLNEHLGQSVAYARMNKITPPWSKAPHHPQPAKKE